MKPNYREIDPQSLQGIEACSLKGGQQPMQFAAMLQDFGVKGPETSIASILKPAPAAPGMAS